MTRYYGASGTALLVRKRASNRVGLASPVNSETREPYYEAAVVASQATALAVVEPPGALPLLDLVSKSVAVFSKRRNALVAAD